MNKKTIGIKIIALFVMALGVFGGGAMGPAIPAFMIIGGIGLLLSREWGRKISIIMLGFSVTVLLFVFVKNGLSYGSRGSLGVLVDGVLAVLSVGSLYYLTRRSVKECFIKPKEKTASQG